MGVRSSTLARWRVYFLCLPPAPAPGSPPTIASITRAGSRLVQEAYGCHFDYSCGQPFYDFVRNLHSVHTIGFEAVIFSGVLYHTIDPLVFIYFVRSLLRPGGIMVLETSLIEDEECFLQFNDKGRFYPRTNYYQISSGWLDYILKYLNFTIVRVAHIEERRIERHIVRRVAILCRFTKDLGFVLDDTWARQDFVHHELIEYLPDRRLPTTDITDRLTPLTSSSGLLTVNRNSLDLTKALKEVEQLTANKDRCVLTLDDRLGRTRA